MHSLVAEPFGWKDLESVIYEAIHRRHSINHKKLIAFLPTGNTEAFFGEVTRANAMPLQDPGVWRAHGMELLGPPLPVE